MNSPNKNKEILSGWGVILSSIMAIFMLIDGHFITAGFTFVFAWWCLYKMQNYKHNQ